MKDLFRLDGKVAVVIGGAGGIGQGIAEAMAFYGAEVVIASRKMESLVRAKSEIKEKVGKDVAIYTVDATNEDSIVALVNTVVSNHKKADILVNAQGYNKKFSLFDFPMDVLADMMNVNVIGVAMACKHFGKVMKENGYGRIIGFTETFEAGGGEILFVSHSADPSEAVQKTNDYMTAYGDTDCIYATGEDYITPAADVIKSRGITDCKIYGSNISPSVCQLIMDGQVEACTGGEFVCGSLAVTLLINYLDGNPIKDADGTAPYFDNLTQFMVTAENAEDLYEFLSDENLATHTISDEEYQNLLVRNNPDVDYDYFYDFLTNYEENVYAKVEANAAQ